MSTVPNIAPLIDPVEIAQIFVERSPTIDLVNWDFLDQDLFGVGFGNRALLLPDVLPLDLTNFEERVLFDLLRVCWPRTQALLRVAIQQSDQQISSLVREELW